MRAALSAKRAARSPVPLSLLGSWLALGTVAVFVIGAGWIVPDATRQDILTGVTPAGPGHLFGTDDLGRDILALAIAGARSAVVGPLLIAVGSMLIGVLLGIPAGYLGGPLDAVVARYADLVLALPATLVALVVAGVVGGGYWVTVAVLVMLFSPSDIRLIRSAAIEQAPRPYIESAKVLGIHPLRIMFRHVAPNVVPVIVANLLLNVAFALVAMSSLSYLGLGVGPGEADWGRQLADGRELLGENAAAVLVPGLLVIATATAANLVGYWLFERLARARVAS